MGLDVELPAQVRRWKDRMHRFVAEELMPLEPDLPPFANRLPAEDIAALVRRMKDAGLWALAVPREFGGGGLGWVGLCALREALGHTTLCSLGKLLGAEPPVLLYDAGEDLRARYLLPTIAGERYGCFALTEPEAGSDAANLSLSAVPDGTGHYLLNGRKVFSSHADEADYALVFGVVPQGPGQAGGITLFLVDRGTPGFHWVRRIETMGGDRPSELVFENCRVPDANRLGATGKAFDLAQRWFACDRIALQPPIALGAAARSLALAQAAGVAPALELGRLALGLHAARAMLYHAAAKADRGEDVRHDASLVKATATSAALEAVERAMAWFGPRGYSRALPLERYYRDLRRFPIAAGTYEIQQFVVARGLLRGYAGLDRMAAPL